MKLIRLLSLTGMTIFLSTVSVNPSFPQSLKDRFNKEQTQQQSEKEILKKNCQIIKQNNQYQKISKYRSLSGDESPPIERYYVDSNNNIHYIYYEHVWNHMYNWSHLYPDVKLKPGRSSEVKPTNCKPFIGKVGESKVIGSGSKCNITYGRDGSFLYSMRSQTTVEWGIEGNELKKYSLTTNTMDCHTPNPRTEDQDIIVKTFTKYR